MRIEFTKSDAGRVIDFLYDIGIGNLYTIPFFWLVGTYELRKTKNGLELVRIFERKDNNDKR